MNQSNSQNYLTVEEVAKELRVAENTIREAIKIGSLKAFKPGKGYRIERVDLDNFIATLKRENTR